MSGSKRIFGGFVTTLQLLQGSFLDLAHPLSADAKIVGNHLQRCRSLSDIG